MIIRMIFLIAGLLLVSAGMGLVPAVKLCKGNKKSFLLWAFVCGMVFQWALFQVISLPFILKERPFSQVVFLYGACAVIWTAGSLVWVSVKGVTGRKRSLRLLDAGTGRAETETAVQKEGFPVGGYMKYVLWGIFVALLLLQLFQAVFLAYADGDDAYYVGVAAVTESSDTMYRVIPYTGETTTLDVRHGLAPFPVWIAFLSRISGCPVTVTAHVALPLILIPLCYLIYAFLGNRIIRDKKWLPVFLILLEVMILWGNYSFYTAETFLLTRSRQGKAAIANIMIPFLFLILFCIGEKLQEQKKAGAVLWLLLAAGVTASCFCTTLGSFFSCLLIGLSGICMAASYKNYKILLPLFLCCIPALICFGVFMAL